MAIRHHITREDEWFTNTARVLEFEVLDSDPADNSDAAPVNATTLEPLIWNLTESSAINAATLIAAHGASVVGVFNADRELNTQRVRVVVTAIETADIQGDKPYYHELRSALPGSESVLSFGDAYLWQSPV